MKLCVQIPAYNEEQTLPQTLAEIPRQIDGVDEVEILVIDDGSTDRTAEVASEHGASHVVRHRRNQGLASAFRSGLDACLKRGADVIVNTDADNQYSGADIPALIAPILAGEADIVVGDRRTDQVEYFSPLKKFLQRFGSAVVRRLSRVEIPDAVSGFRALSREAALKINILSTFSYTLEMLIQSGHKRMAVTSVPVHVNPMTRRSRLYSSVFGFIKRSLATLVRSYAMYQPLKIFVFIGLLLMLVGAVPIVRFLYYFGQDGGAGHIQSLVIGGVLTTMGFIAFLVGLVADLIAFNRQLMEILLEKVRRLEEGKPSRPE